MNFCEYQWPRSPAYFGYIRHVSAPVGHCICSMRPGAEGQLGLRAGATRGVEVEHTHTSHRLVATLWPVVRPTRRSHDSRWRRYIPRSPSRHRYVLSLRCMVLGRATAEFYFVTHAFLLWNIAAQRTLASSHSTCTKPSSQTTSPIHRATYLHLSITHIPNTRQTETKHGTKTLTKYSYDAF